MVGASATGYLRQVLTCLIPVVIILGANDSGDRDATDGPLVAIVASCNDIGLAVHQRGSLVDAMDNAWADRRE